MLYGSTITLDQDHGNIQIVLSKAHEALTKAIADKKKECITLFKQFGKIIKAMKKKNGDIQSLMQQVQIDPTKFAADNGLQPYMNACSQYQCLQGYCNTVNRLQGLIVNGYSITIPFQLFDKIESRQFLLSSAEQEGLGPYISYQGAGQLAGGIGSVIPTPDNDFGSSVG